TALQLEKSSPCTDSEPDPGILRRSRSRIATRQNTPRSVRSLPAAVHRAGTARPLPDRRWIQSPATGSRNATVAPAPARTCREESAAWYSPSGVAWVAHQVICSSDSWPWLRALPSDGSVNRGDYAGSEAHARIGRSVWL